MVIILYQS